MTDNRPAGQPNGELATRAGVRRRLVQVMFTVLIQALSLFLSAGRLDWIAAWAYLGVGLCILAYNLLVIVPRNPEMVAERGRVREDSKGWDKVLGVLISIFGPLLLWIVAGLDERFEWSPGFPVVVQVVGLVFVALGNGLFSWSMASNPFFSGVVRIQEDRGHTVATAGPYRFVRHPGYTAYITFTLAAPLLLGSLWALIPGAITMCLFVLRTVLEDRTLHEELDGYSEYAQRVRYRLLPGIW